MLTILSMNRQSATPPNVLPPDLEEGGAVRHLVLQIRREMEKRGWEKDGEPDVTRLRAELAAIGVTVRWQTVQSWCLGKLGTLPEAKNLSALAQVFDMTVDELIGVVSGFEPNNDAWRTFVETTEGKKMTPRQRALTARFVADGEPTVSTYLLALAAVLSATPPKK